MRRIGMAGALGAGLLTLWWTGQPRTPEALFVDRCGTCHAVPDLSVYAAEDMAPIVATMRQRNGADQVIDEREAAVITQYLEDWRRQQ